MLQYTGHPFVDVGVAVIEHHCHKPCEELTEADLEKAAQWITDIYSRKDLKGYLTVHFPNSGWCNATISEKKKKIYINNVLSSYSYDSLIPNRKCSFCNQPAQFLADRQHIPMLTGTTLLVTAPYGVTGLPVCGCCLLAVQFYPLATIKAQGKPLFWWTPNPELTYWLVEDAHKQVMQALTGSDDKFPNLNWPRTRLLETAKKVVDIHTETDNIVQLADCIGYHVTNYGSGPDYKEYFIPKALLEFWRDVRFESNEVRTAHNWIINSHWEKPKAKKSKKGIAEDPEVTEAVNTAAGLRNYYFEDLSKTFDSREWQQGVRVLISKYHLINNPENFGMNCFALAELFLRKVGGMDKQRLEVIKKIADIITDVLINGNNDEKWLTILYRMKSNSTSDFLRYLVKAQKKLSEFGKPISFDDILIMLDLASEDDASNTNFWLVRELFLLRMIERIGKNNQHLLQQIEDGESLSEEEKR